MYFQNFMKSNVAETKRFQSSSISKTWEKFQKFERIKMPDFLVNIDYIEYYHSCNASKNLYANWIQWRSECENCLCWNKSKWETLYLQISWKNLWKLLMVKFFYIFYIFRYLCRETSNVIYWYPSTRIPGY